MKIVYIDAQNTHKAIQRAGRMIDWQKFFIYLTENCKADQIFFAVWYRKEYEWLYHELSGYGYTMLFKKTTLLPDWSIKWNVDIDIAIRVILDLFECGLHQAYIMTNDGDYNTLVDLLVDRGKLWHIITPNHKEASRLLKQSAWWRIQDVQRIKHLVEKQKT